MSERIYGVIRNEEGREGTRVAQSAEPSDLVSVRDLGSWNQALPRLCMESVSPSPPALSLSVSLI